MSFCSRCDRPYGDGSGDGECDLAAIEDELEAVGYDPAHSPPIPFGAETTVFFAGWGSALATVPDRPTCPDCGVRRGCYHHAGCSVEQCGECRQQAIDCDCLAIDDEERRRRPRVGRHRHEGDLATLFGCPGCGTEWRDTE